MAFVLDTSRPREIVNPREQRRSRVVRVRAAVSAVFETGSTSSRREVEVATAPCELNAE